MNDAMSWGFSRSGSVAERMRKIRKRSLDGYEYMGRHLLHGTGHCRGASYSKSLSVSPLETDKWLWESGTVRGP